MKIFGWAADNEACGYYRLMLPLGELAKRGHETLVHGAMPRDWRETADIIIAQRTCLGTPEAGPTHRWQELARQDRAALVYDIDDDLFDVHPTNLASQLFNRPNIRENLRRNIEVSHLVTCSTPELAEVISKINPNVAVLPNTLDRERINRVVLPARDPANPEDPVIIGWGGSATHGIDWQQIHPHLLEVVRRRRNVKVRFLGTAYPEELPRHRVEKVGWTYDFDEHYRNVSKFTIGVAPLAPIPFNESKSWLKVLEYAAMGVPTIASATPAYRQFIEHNATGILVDSPLKWRHALLELVDDPQARLELAVNARICANEWMIQNKVGLWESTYQRLLSSRTPDPAGTPAVQPAA